MAVDGLLRTFHQPSEPIWSTGSSEVKNRPIVGTSHSRPTMMRNAYTGACDRARTMRVETLSWSAGTGVMSGA